ncbi:WxcM-like domain-containing protein [Maribacter chungangensis]|uniref:WxcM-like domain-containing protein n=1 Tax=Maribacter chungangensis TaxID=1069117 RepID=A0ABW3B8P7_9FLAO
MGSHSLIQGTLHEDHRGIISFFNTLDLSRVKRMYQIQPANEQIIRAWQGHKTENKWFHCLQGSFIINLVKVTDFEHPVTDAKISYNVITANTPTILYVEGGYASGIKSTAPNSKLLVFSDLSTEASKNDDYRFDLDLWMAKWE